MPNMPRRSKTLRAVWVKRYIIDGADAAQAEALRNTSTCRLASLTCDASSWLPTAPILLCSACRGG